MKEVIQGRGSLAGAVPSLVFRRDVSSIVLRRSQLPHLPTITTPARDLFHALSQPTGIEAVREQARAFLDEKIAEASLLHSGLPKDMTALPTWLEQRCLRVRMDYQAYLADRHAGHQPRYFSGKSHALHFLQSMAPSRMVEGAWLYGCLKHWRKAKFAPLCRFYLRNLGDGDESSNQVSLYQQLLDQNGCSDWRGMADQYYVQGAIRLALGHHVDDYLPEIIGFNLGYEQVSLPMLIAAYELSEMGVQPHYFTLQATEDDTCVVATIKLLCALLDEATTQKDQHTLLQRVANGYKLHQLGLGIPEIVASFDLQQAFLGVIQPYAVHIERAYRIDCMERGIRGRWPDSLPLPLLLQQLCHEGWMQADVKGKTRLWQVLERGHCLPWDAYQQQILLDWIDSSQEYVKRLRYTDMPAVVMASSPITHITAAQSSHHEVDNTQEDVMDYIIRLLSPVVHYTQESLKAARVYKSILDKGSELYAQHYAFFLGYGPV